MKLADAMKTKAASIGVENTIENKIEAAEPVPSKKRTSGQANAEVTSAPSKRRKIEKKEQAPAVEQAPAKIQAPKELARQNLKTYTSTRSRSTSAQPAAARSKAPRSDTQKTVSQSKVANGLQHELERLGAPPANLDGRDEKDGKRKLRSEGRAKFKSELGVYFPEYEVIMGNEEAAETSMFTQLSDRISYTNLPLDLLEPETPILIVDTAPSMPKPRWRSSTSPTKRSKPRKPDPTTSDTSSTPAESQPAFRQFSSDLFSNLHNAQQIDLAMFGSLSAVQDAKEDPLADELYKGPHLREERKEKGIKSQETVASLYARAHIAQLLEGLQGPDWLKTLGVRGVVTEAKQVGFKEARTYFIKKCVAYLRKCKEWKEVEKRRGTAKKRKAEKLEEDDGNDSDGDPPDYSDVDYAAAMQLHAEAVKRSAPYGGRNRSRGGSAPPSKVVKPQKPITSFFAKPHLREAALSTKRRRSNRGVLAFGSPIPDVPEKEFELSDEIRKAVAAARSQRSPRKTTRRGSANAPAS